MYTYVISEILDDVVSLLDTSKEDYKYQCTCNFSYYKNFVDNSNQGAVNLIERYLNFYKIAKLFYWCDFVTIMYNKYSF